MTILRQIFFNALFCAAVAAPAAQAAPVLMISIDGLRPGDVLEAPARGLKIPALRALMEGGSYADGVRNVLPTVTYPNHTTLITGVWPSKHGIPGNQTFDPLRQNMDGWYWYSSDIKVPTLWDAVHQTGGKVASLSWPVSVGARSIDYNLPEYWRARIPEDMKLLRVLSTPGLVAMLEKSTGIMLSDADGEGVDVDVGRTRYTAALIAARHPKFTTLHLRGLDHIEHESGPGSPQAHAALEALDDAIGNLVAYAREAEPDLVVAIVSDHGFAPIEHEVNLIAPFIQAGLITLDGTKVKDWQAEPWGGASVAVVLKHPEDSVLKAKVAALLQDLAARPELGIAQVADANQIAQMGGSPMASFWLDMKIGYGMSANPAAPTSGASANKGTHGWFPTDPEMRATFILNGPGIAKRKLGEIDMRDIAPSLAKVMQVPMPSADGHPLF